ncbi:MAG: relaxase/mobilization nuclease domain-containing protein, partial [Pseudomonadota bacterium]
MANSTSAVEQVVGVLFERKKRSSAGTARQVDMAVRSARQIARGVRRPSVARMSRVGAKDGAAVFKLIRSGGTKTRAGLRGQMNYIFNDAKLAGLWDSSGRLGNDGTSVDRAVMNQVIRGWSQSWWDNTRNGNTSHMILSYPATASVDQIYNTTRDVLDELLGQPGRAFDYVAAIHDDRAHHPHVHVIVNRRTEDKTLFNLRSDTDLSYERFREAMAEHGRKYDLDLDPSFRFERGITDRQPDYSEQLAAQLENRAPQQRPRIGADLDYQQDLVEYARIGYESMAVIAVNADDDRLADAYDRISQVLDNDGVNTEMPALTDDQIQKFEDTKALFEDALKSAQSTLESRDAAARAEAERQLDNIMRDFTQLSSTAPFAKDLHAAPDSNSIYMHGPGEYPERLQEARLQYSMELFERNYGLSAEAVAARIEIGAASRNLEQQWMHDDLAKVAARDGLNLDNAADREKAIATLEEAYGEMRGVLVDAQVIRYLPHLDDDFEMATIKANQPATVEDVVAFYRDNGAPEIWIDENRAVIVDTVSDINKELEATIGQPLPEEFSNTDWQDFAALQEQFRGTDFNYGYSEDAQARESGRLQTERAAASFTTFADRSPVHAVIASKAWDDATDIIRGPQGYLRPEERAAVLERDLIAEGTVRDALAKYAERSSTERVVTRTDEERAELVRLVRENTTPAERALLREGNIEGLRSLTDDETFARQITSAYEVELRREGVALTREAEQRFAENERAISAQFTR